MKTEQKKREEQYLDALIRLSVDLEKAEQLQSKITGEEDAPVAQEQVHAAWTKAMQKREAEKKQRWEGCRRTAGWLMKGMARVAACILAVIVVGVPIAVASSATVRGRLLQMLIEIDEKQEEIRFHFVKEKQENAVVPEGWIGEYYPTVVPAGMKVVRVGENSPFVEYESENDSRIRWGFTEMDEYTGLTMGTKGATVYEGEINGCPAYIVDEYSEISDTREITIVWSDDDMGFLVYGSGLEMEEIKKIAESVKKI